ATCCASGAGRSDLPRPDNGAVLVFTIQGTLLAPPFCSSGQTGSAERWTKTMKETSQADGKMQPTSAAYEQTAIGARAAELERLKSHFMAAMSHELRAPVNLIIASTDLLTGARLSAEQFEPIGCIRENC